VTARDARTHDDWREDPDNPLVPFRMSDRMAIHDLQTYVKVGVGILSAGTTALVTFLAYLVMH
jgi:hypothetical protein